MKKDYFPTSYSLVYAAIYLLDCRCATFSISFFEEEFFFIKKWGIL